MAIRGERFSDYGFNWRNLGKSIALAVCVVVVYDLALSLQAGKCIWVPLRRHNAVRISFAAGFIRGQDGRIVSGAFPTERDSKYGRKDLHVAESLLRFSSSMRFKISLVGWQSFVGRGQ